MIGPAGHGALQHGSLGEGEVFVTVQMEYKSKQLQAALLVDTACDMDIIISEYQASQLGFAFRRHAIGDEMVAHRLASVQVKQSNCVLM